MRLQKIIMESRAPRKLADFYEQLLELPVEQKHEEVTVMVGRSRLQFTKAKNGDDPFYHFAINIPANKIEEAKKWLSTKLELLWLEDYKSHIADFSNWNAKSVYFFDPLGNIVELIARFDLKNQNPEPFSSAQMLSVSEIGIVFPQESIQEETERLMQQFGVSYFSKQPPFPQFKAVGDDNGLSIIVSEGRNWYPTQDKKAGIFPLEVQVQVDERLNTYRLRKPG